VVAVLEAMKMQNILRAERDGVVKVVSVKSGDSVAADEVLVEFA
jgi:propionyl-CoA carboxylase alpha chain